MHGATPFVGVLRQAETTASCSVELDTQLQNAADETSVQIGNFRADGHLFGQRHSLRSQSAAGNGYSDVKQQSNILRQRQAGKARLLFKDAQVIIAHFFFRPQGRDTAADKPSRELYQDTWKHGLLLGRNIYYKYYKILWQTVRKLTGEHSALQPQAIRAQRDEAVRWISGLASALLVNLTTMSDKVHKDLLFRSVASI
jgi:hypothetical protein